MDDEQIYTKWQKYLSDLFKYRLINSEIPFLFKHPFCGSCYYCNLIDDDGIKNLLRTSSYNEYEIILNDMNGKRLREYREDGKFVESYRDHRFYGWCRRYPPIHRDKFSVIGFKSLFSLYVRNVHKKISEYDFPLIPHDCSCGEWKRGPWVANFLKENETT